jgi:hypothetical protein
MGVEGGIAKAIAQMDKLHALLSEKHIGLSVSVYPGRSNLIRQGGVPAGHDLAGMV